MGTYTWTRNGSATGLQRPRPGLDVGQLLSERRDARPATVVIPVYNGGDAVRSCLESVVRWSAGARVVVIDDASTDPAVIALLDRFAAEGRVELVRHPHNWGYTRTANHALHLEEDADVVLLNSDTEVGPMWLPRLQWVAASRPGVATVSAVSDNAGALAMPVQGVANEWPTHLSWDEIATAAAQADLPWAVETPTGHGFCMLVSRAAIRALHGFDEERFPRGYGEENDFCMRAREQGMVNLVAPHVLVKHARSQSFGSEREALIAEGRRAVDERHPTYTADIREWLSGAAMQDVRQRLAGLLTDLTSRQRVLPRRLYALHASGGGTPATNLDLMTALAHQQEAYLVESAGLQRLVLHRVHAKGYDTLGTWQADDRFRVTDTWRQDYAEAITEWLVRLGIETVHIRHLINHPLTTLPDVTRRLGVPMVLSTHDFYMVCPSVHLLDDQDRYCGGRCTPGEGVCRLPTPFVAEAKDLKHSWINEWQRRADTVFRASSAVVATTPSAAAVLASSYPHLANGITLIEHGRDIERGWDPLRREGSRRAGPLRILAVANWDPHKGTEYVRTMAAVLGPDAEFHILGQRSDTLDDIGIPHGPYQRNGLPALVAEVDPDFVALVSIWPETYSHTLTEAWALGVPVVATDIGAVAERIRTYGGGVLVPVSDPARAAETVRSLSRDPKRLAALRESVPREGVRSRAAMAEDYRALYEKVRAPRTAPTRLGYLVRGSLGQHPGSAHVRVLRRLENSTDGATTFRQAFAEDIVRQGSCDLDVLLVQRDALAHPASQLLPVVRQSGTRLVVELDDDLVTDAATGRLSADVDEDSRLRHNLRAVLREADGVVVSTPVLADTLADMTRAPITVVENLLDARLWRSEVTPDPPPRRDEHRVLYMGSKTHRDDLMLLRDVIDLTAERVGKKVVLEVVGIADRFEDDGWVKRLRLPKHMQQYPDFVRWLRTHRARWAAAAAPLVDSRFNRAKSDLKLLEYAGLGLRTVASRVGPYAEASDLAVLTDNTVEGWVQALSSVLSDPDSAMRDAAEAAGWVHKSRMLERGRDDWLDAVLGQQSVGGQPL